MLTITGEFQCFTVYKSTLRSRTFLDKITGSVVEHETSTEQTFVPTVPLYVLFRKAALVPKGELWYNFLLRARHTKKREVSVINVRQKHGVSMLQEIKI